MSDERGSGQSGAGNTPAAGNGSTNGAGRDVQRRGGGSGGMGRGPIGFGRGGPRFSMPVEKPRDFKGTMKRLTGYLRPWSALLIVVFLAAALSTVFRIVTPKIVGQAITTLWNGVVIGSRGAGGVDFDSLLHTLIFLAGLYVTSAAFGYLQQYLMAGIAQRSVFAMRKDVDEKLARLPLRYYDHTAHGEILSRVTNDIDLVSTTLQQSLTQLITAVVTLVGVVVMMLTINPLMTLITFLALPLSVVLTRPIIKRSQKYFKNRQASLGELNGHVEEMYTGHKIVKAFGREPHSIQEFEARNQRLYEAEWRAQFISGVIWPVMNLVNNIGYVIVSVVGSIFVTRGLMQIGDVQAFIQYSRQFAMPITQTAQIANILQSTVAAAERVFEVLDESEEIQDAEDAVQLEAPKGDVRFEEVDFSYKADEPLIEGMNIDVQSGQTIAVVGPTGAGKTTLVNLLMRFYEIDAGRITVDGVDIRNVKRGNLRSIFGMVLQDTWLFKGTIRDNIAYGRENVSEEEIVQAAEAAHADHMIRTLPEGYDTMLNEEASNLSQGQKQLLTIARAILADPAILILDEATSSVDTRTEVHVQRAMLNLMHGRTSFVIAHRLSTIRNADMILVMNHGRVIETGTHEGLLAQDGFYADLYNSQFTGSNQVAG